MASPDGHDGATRLVFVRHGESRAVVDRVIGGATGCRGLTDHGRRQAEALRDRLALTGEIKADALVASTLPRAIETAEILAPALGDLPLELDPDLVELIPGECDGLSEDEYLARFGRSPSAHPDRPLSPGGENLRDFHDRIKATVDRVAREHSGETAVIVSHGGFITGACLTFLGGFLLPESRRFWRNPENTALSIWSQPGNVGGMSDGRPPWILERYNDHAHLALLVRAGQRFSQGGSSENVRADR